MADVALAPTVISGAPGSHRQVILPSLVKSSFLADDTDNYILKIDGRGKGNLLVAIDNPANQTVIATLYGMFSAAGAIGAADVFPISGGTITVTAAADKDYQICADLFPFYLINLNYAVAPTDDPAKTCSVYVAFVS